MPRSPHRLVALVCILIALVCLGCSNKSPNTTAPTSSPTAQVYSSDQYGFTFKYESPTLATRDPEKMPDVAYAPIVLLANTYHVGNETAIFYVNVPEDGGKIFPPGITKSQAMRRLRARDPLLKQATVKNVGLENATTSSHVGLLNGVPTWFFTADFDPSAPGYEKQVNQALVFARGRTYGVVWTSCKKTTDADAAAIAEAAASFTTKW